MRWVAAGLLVIAAIVIALMLMMPSATIRYRLTLEALVEGQRKTGSQVVEVGYHGHPKLLPNESEFSVSIKGQALLLDLGRSGFLLALLREGNDVQSAPEGIALNALGKVGVQQPFGNRIDQVRKLSGKVELPLTNLPLLVRFRDLNAPLTVERVNPLDLESSFGTGVKLVRATLEIVPAGIWPLNQFGWTGEPITTGLAERLPWLKNLKGGYLGGGFTSKDAPLGLHEGNFERR
ncbi:hypothetical protein [Bradyrhizobium australiense]|uniref:Uncharacterized protein n=1 Tax=Bradyrhizobium australiense TaxID=2721161 RepID=A0A7Y4GW15_9BRAD|nr:hypothetical protein [Bradyrhizobium australiense]NOJ43015.1 hypothetical protein [Bradyrhizobium australiense]